jgi:hypothetical protein
MTILSRSNVRLLGLLKVIYEASHISRTDLVEQTGYTGCGKTPDSRLVLPSERIFGLFGPFRCGFLVSFCTWRPFFRPPGRLRPYWASDSFGISLRMRIRLCATMVSR